MTRKKTNLIHEYFIQKEGKSYCQCLRENKELCAKKIITHATNLAKHVMSQHEDDYKDYLKRKEELEKSNSTSDNEIVPPKKQKLLNTFEGFDLQSHKVKKVKLSYEDIERACVLLVTVDGRPFSIIHDEGFQKILTPLLEAVDSKENCFKTMNRFKIRTRVIETAKHIRDSIKDSVCGKLISVKLDGAQRHHRHFLGITIQLFTNDELKVFTLGCIELEVSSTAENLQKEVLKVLEKYGIEIDQIFTITTDNGANYVKCGTLVDQIIEKNQPTVVQACTSVDVDEEDDDFELESVTVEEVSDEDDCDDDVITPNNDEMDDNGVEELKVLTDFQWSDATNVASVRCVAHTLQLAVHRFLKGMPTKELDLEKIRKIICVLRTSKCLREIKQRKLLFPIIDVLTRWSSTFYMLRRLLTLKDYINEISKYNAALKITDVEWKCVKIIVDVLEPCEQLTVSMQRMDYNFNDFFREWKKCIFQLKKIEHSFGFDMIFEMEAEEQRLFSNPAFAASIFLNPSFKHNLKQNSGSQVLVNKTICYLSNLMKRMETLENRKKESGKNDINAEEKLNLESENHRPKRTNDKTVQKDICVNSAIDSSDALDEFDVFMAPVIITPPEDEDKEKEDDVEAILRRYFDNHPYVSNRETENILAYWANEKDSSSRTLPVIRSLSNIIFSIPATQVTVERLFSHLHYIFSDLRCSIASKILDDILICRLNKEYI